MYNVDFLAVENKEADGERSGDAIIIRSSVEGRAEPAIIVVDAGFTDTGQQVVDHISKYYGTNRVDLVISTHPDTDHLNGIKTVMEQCEVVELLIHQPWMHSSEAHLLGNYERLRDVYDLAVANGVTVREPFTGVTALGGLVRVLGPQPNYYVEQLLEAIYDVRTGKAAARSTMASASGGLLAHAGRALEKALSYMPFETLTDEDDTSARNKTSAVSLLSLPGGQVLLTGDTGIKGLSNAIDEYERLLGPIRLTQPWIFQAPHHGSKHNLGPAILDRILGERSRPFGAVKAVISSARASEKHPSPKVTNALNRRGALTRATEGQSFGFSSPGAAHPDWTGAVPPIGPLDEDD